MPFMPSDNAGSLSRADQRAMLMSRMLDATAVVSPSACNERFHRELNAAYRRCLGCRQASVCRDWLNGQRPETNYREFCPNAKLFERLR